MGGWCTFFLLQLGLCAIILSMSFISNFTHRNYYIVGSETIMYIGVACDIISLIFIVVYAISVISSFIKRKPIAIQLAMSYLFALFINAHCKILETILIPYTNITYTNIMGLLGDLICIIWSVIWLIYLYHSKHMEELFPLSTRITKKTGYLPIALIVLPPVTWLLLVIVY